jgi:DNA-binding NtrC family response regulator
MSRRLHLELELPDEVLTHVRDEEIALQAKEALVMALLRDHRISQGKAAEVLGIHRHDLFDLMGKYHVPAIDMTEEELRTELQTPFPRP